MKCRFLYVGEKVVDPTSGLALAAAAIRLARPSETPAVARETFLGRLVLQAPNRQLLDVIRARHATGCLPCSLNC